MQTLTTPKPQKAGTEALGSGQLRHQNKASRQYWPFAALLVLVLMLSSNTVFAQLTGTKTVPGDYATLALAVADLNTQGVGAGGVTINVAAGHTETAPAGGISIMTNTASSSNPVIIQKSGGGANPTITANAALTAGDLNDAVIKIIGTDNVTINGFTLLENPANTTTTAASNNMTEWGIALLYETATNGSQNCSIRNCTIDLDRTYQNTFGVYSNSTHTPTAPTTSATATGTAGGNSGLTITTNTITDVNNGIVVVGPTAAADHNDLITIGGSSMADGNTLTNYGTTGTFSGFANVSGTVNGILVRNSKNIIISNNSITSSSGASGVTSGTLRAIFIPAASNQPTGTFTNEINNNTVSLTSHLASGAVLGILVESTTSSPTSTTNINNNIFTSLAHSIASPTGAITGISQSGSGTAGPLIHSISGNRFSNLTCATTGSFTFITNSWTRPANGSSTVSNNSIETGFNKTGGGGTVQFYNSNSSSPNTVIETNSGNNFSNVTVTGATTIAGWVSTDGPTAGTGPAKTITNNTFNNLIGGTSAVTGLNVAYGTSGTVSGNVVSNITAAAAITGITSAGGSEAFTQNTVHSLVGSGTGAVTGIVNAGAVTKTYAQNLVYNIQNTNAGGSANGFTISGGTTVNLTNNLIGNITAPIASGTTAAVRGINVTSTTSSSNINLSFNTVYLNASSTGANFSSAALHVTTSTTATTAALTLRNNIFFNTSTPTGTGVATAYWRSSSSLANYTATSNNNLFYAGTPSATTPIFFDGTTPQNDLAAFKLLVTPRETASVTEAVSFQSTTGSDAAFLHINPSVATQLESGGIAVSGITTDYDGDTRNATTPDIGADEGNFTPNDMVGPTITYTPLANNCGAGARTLTATITDASGVPTAGAGLPVLYWAVNSAAGPFTNTATATSLGSNQYQFTFGGSAAVGDVVHYYIVAQDLVATPNLSANPSAGAAGFTPNPPAASTPPTAPNSYTNLQSLSGTYTVGAAGNYPTLTAAVADYNTKCLSGPVVFSLVDANYSTNETFPIVINANVGSSAVNTLTIKPTLANTVITGSVGTGALIKLNGADYVILDGSVSGTSRDLTISNATTTTSGNAVVWIASPALGNGSNNNTVKNCIIEGTASTTTTGMLGIYVGGNATLPTSLTALTQAGLERNDNNTITNNLIRKLAIGIAMFGWASNTPDLNNIVSNNNIGSTTDGLSFEGIHADRQENLVISGNEVQNILNPTTTSNVFGIRLLDFKNGQCYNNKIHDISYTGTSTPKLYGIAVSNSTYTTSGNPSNALIYNNMVYKITSTGTSTVWNSTGILAGVGYGDKYHYNSVDMSGQLNNSSAGLSAAFAVGDGNITGTATNVVVRNNIFNVTGSSTGGNVWAFYNNATSFAGSVSNNNVLRCAGTGATNNTGRFNSINYVSLADWQTATAQDANSFAFNPQFISTSDLHINTAAATPVESGGTPVSGISTDIDGDARNGSTPDIGADEGMFTQLLQNDVRALAFIDPLNGGTKPAGIAFAPQASFENLGITAQTNVPVRYKITGPSPATTVVYEQTATIPSLGVGATQTVTFPNATIAAGGSYAISAKAELVGDQVPANDEITGTLTVSAPLSGTYDVGSSQAAPFNTLTNAVGALNILGVGGPVVFRLTDASYGASETFPIVINQFPGGSSTNTVTIRPAAGVATTVSGSSTSCIIRLNGADFVTIDGSNAGSTDRNLTIQNNSTASNTACLCVQSLGTGAGATDNTIKNTKLLAGSNTATSTFGIHVAGTTVSTSATGDDNDNLTIDNNEISKAYYGIYAAAASTGVLNNLAITKNKIGSATAGNEISNRGIRVVQADNLNISQDTIFNFSSNSTTIQVTAIETGTGVTNSSITRNWIYDINYTGATNRAGQGISLNTGATGANITVANNMIAGLKGHGSSTASNNSWGIMVLSGGDYTIAYNSINIPDNRTSTSSVDRHGGIYLASTATNVTLKNNNVSVTGNPGNAGGFMHAIYSLAATPFASSNNNNFYVAGTQHHVGYINSTNQTLLSDWQTASGQDASSLSVAPVFNTATDLHLIPASNIPLNAAGMPVAGIVTDFDGDTRDAATPDIGADEFVGAGPCAGTPDPGNTLSSAASVCPDVNFTLSLSNFPLPGTGITYQWESATSLSGPWTTITGANSATLVTSQTAATFYRCVVTCTNSGQSANSAPLEVTMAPVANCYCAAGASNTSSTFEKISNVQFGTINNPSTSSAGYEDFTAVSASIDRGTTNSFTATLSNGFDDDEIIVWIDLNIDGDFNDTGEELFNSPTGVGPHSGNITIPVTATLGTTRMRIRLHDSVLGPNTTPCGNSTYGQVEDYTIVITAPTPCAGTPTPGATTASANNVCSGTAVTFGFDGSVTGTGLTYQWQSSPDGIAPYTDISGAQSATYMTTPAATAWYQCVVTCTNSGQSATSTPLQHIVTVITNDDPCGATTVTVGTSCNYTTYSWSCATASAGIPAPGCASYSTGDVWFKVVVPASGHLVFDTDEGAITDGGMAIYAETGTCPSNTFTLIECDDDDSNNGNMPMININTLVPGSTVYIRIWDFSDATAGSLGLCVYEPCTPVTWYQDLDGDTYGNPAVTQQSCTQPTGYVANDDDCDDANINVNPAATEVCNTIDDDCDGMTDEGVTTTFYADNDGDTYGDATGNPLQACSAPTGFVTNNTDCNDANINVNPGATEVCNTIDDDCDGLTDEGVTTTFYADADGDTYGNAAVTQQACTAPTGYVANDDDCNDANINVNPGATEVCNTIDDDCDGLTDEGVTTTFYADADGDTYGNAAVTQQACTAPTGYVANDDDCNDANINVNPGATEVCNTIDDDCDGLTDEGVTTTFYADADGDTYGNAAVTQQACTAPTGYVANDDDCNDANINVNPGATEVCNTIDDDCDGLTDEGVTTTFYADADGDTYGNAAVTQQACTAPTGYVANDDDCDDANININPGAAEICNSLDDDCDGMTDEGAQIVTWYADADGDTYGNPAVTQQSCAQPTGYVLNDDDCNDANINVNPGATETCNGVDDDCDGLTDEGVLTTFYADTDGDTYGNPAVSQQACSAPTGFVTNNTDCNDANIAVNPAATEVFNGIDDDCDGLTDEGTTSTLAIAATDAVKMEGNAGNTAFTFNVARSGNTTGTTTVDYAVTGTGANPANAADFGGTLPSGTVTFATGETNKGITVNVAGDLTVEPDETFVVTLSNPSIGASITTATGSGSILNDDCTLLTWYQDSDGDTYGNPAVSTQACTQPQGYVANDDDCDDANININPGAAEICNSLDDDCDGMTDEGAQIVTWYADADGDTYGNPAVTQQSCAQPTGYVLNDDDCNDANINVNPGATETCNGVDDDCDGLTDEGVLTTFYADTDGDTYGNPAVSQQACSAPTGFVTNNTDCNDANIAVNPAATEVFNGIDDDCDGLTDEGTTSTLAIAATDAVKMEGNAGNTAFTFNVARSGNTTGTTTVDYAVTGTGTNPANAADFGGTLPSGTVTFATGETNKGITVNVAGDFNVEPDETFAVTLSNPSIGASITTATGSGSILNDDCTLLTWYQDSDGDTYGNPAVSTQACTQPQGYVANDDDCDDANININPGAAEICNSIDDDCDGMTDEGAQIVTWYADADGDTYGNPAVTQQSCAQPTGYVLNDDDCNDANINVNPGATETCNGVDDDCDGLTDEGVTTTFYADADGDTYGNPAVSQQACTAPAGYVANDDDCNDANIAVNPGATETCNGVDDDCDGLTDEGVITTFYADADGDTYGNPAVSQQACTAPAGYVANDDDCNDANIAVNPGATEVCNGMDDDCDGLTDEGVLQTFYADADSDGYGNAAVSQQACTAPAGYVANNTDCNDNNDDIYPTAPELCDGLDNDCDSQVDEFITGITVGNFSQCNANGTSDPGDDFITANVTVTFSTIPTNGNLVLSGSGAASVPVANLSGNSHTFPNVMIPSNGGVISFTAAFSNASACSFTNPNAGTAPGNCSGTCFIEIVSLNTTPESCTGSTDGTITVNVTSSGGQIGYSIDGGITFQLTNHFENLQAGSYNIVVIIYGTNCSDSDFATVALGTSTQTWYKDWDNDGYSDGVSQVSCSQPANYKLASQLIATSGDCNDYNPEQFPGQTWYKDADSDGYSDGVTLVQCTQPAGYQPATSLLATSGDCNDNNANVNPAMAEICDGIDNDCDGVVDEGLNDLTYVGNVTFTSQTQVNNWNLCYTVIQGNLVIKNLGINNITKLMNLRKVTGNVTIENTGLDDLDGLNSLDTVGGNLIIKINNAQLASLDGIEGLTRVGGNLQVVNNSKLTDCCAIYDLLNTAGGIGGSVSIFSNETGCDNVAEVNTTCAGGNNIVIPQVAGYFQDVAAPQSISLFPNPTAVDVTVMFERPCETGQVKLFDLQGRTVFLAEVEANASQYLLPVEKLRSGTYLVQVILDGESFTQKLVIK